MPSTVVHLAAGEYLGSVRTRREAAGLVLTETAYAAETRIPRHRHDAATFFLLLQGVATQRSRAEVVSLRAGGVCFSPPDEPHDAKIGGRSPRAFNLEVPTGWFDGADAPAWQSLPRDLSGSGCATVLASLLGEVARWDDASPMAVQGLVLQFGALLRRARGAPERASTAAARRAEEILRERFAQPLDWLGIAAECGAPAGALLRAFTARTGTSPARYLRVVRTERLAGWLRSSDLPLSELALDAGFYDQAHMTRAFRAAIGLTPGAYRRLARAGSEPPIQ